MFQNSVLPCRQNQKFWKYSQCAIFWSIRNWLNHPLIAGLYNESELIWAEANLRKTLSEQRTWTAPPWLEATHWYISASEPMHWLITSTLVPSMLDWTWYLTMCLSVSSRRPFDVNHSTIGIGCPLTFKNPLRTQINAHNLHTACWFKLRLNERIFVVFIQPNSAKKFASS